MKRFFSAPTTVNLELTEACNARCRYCYNHWRRKESSSERLSRHQLDTIIDELADTGVFHVILSGGEPMLSFSLLEHALKRLAHENISVSCNSNLMVVDDEKAKRLAGAGLDHILTSLPSPDATVCDYLTGTTGSLARIQNGIRTCIRHAIRVSANMVVTRANMGQVVESGKLLAGLGAQRLFVTRAVPPVYETPSPDSTDCLSPDEQKRCLDDAIRVRDEFGLMVGSLVSYPLCFLKDLVRFKDFVGRGCPAQAGHRTSIGVTGEVHACVHENESYGSIFEKRLGLIYQGAMRKWHAADLYYPGCRGCRYLHVCETGCRMSALGNYGSHRAKDPLFVGPQVFADEHDASPFRRPSQSDRKALRFTVPRRLRFRQEDGYCLLNIRWGNTITVPHSIADWLKACQKSGQPFAIDVLGAEHVEPLWQLYLKDALETDGARIADNRRLQGLSLNPELLEREPYASESRDA